MDTFMQHFSIIVDPRIDRCKKHNLHSIIGISLVGVICGCDSWVEIEDYATEKEDLLRDVFDLKNGIPSHDTIGRVMAAMDPVQFNDALIAWTKDIMKEVEGEVIAIDGKALRGSANDYSGKGWITTVNVWACANQLVLGQAVVDSKSNEITAIPELLDKLGIKGHTITIDAMGTQKDIAAKIVDKQGDYLLALKGNHPELYEEVKSLFSYIDKQVEIHKESNDDKGHGRIEHREVQAVSISQALDWLDHKDLQGWKGLSSLVKITSKRTIKGQTSKQVRYFISSIEIAQLGNRRFLDMIRAHWSIENKLHWTLDVCFREDYSQVYQGNADANFSILRKLAMNLLKSHPHKASMKRKRQKAGWNDQFLKEVITQL